MKKVNIIAFLLLAACKLNAQALQAVNIDSCYEWAKQAYPLIRQKGLIEKTRDFTVENAAKGYFPQVTVAGQATYQSDVVAFAIPGSPVLAKDQYKIGFEVNQSIYDAGQIRNNKETQRLNADIQNQNLEVNLYTVRDRVNQLYFGVLLIEEQLKQNGLRKSDIQNGLDKVSAAYANGTSFKSSVDELKAEVVAAEQTDIELQSNRKAFVTMLGLMTNKPIDANTVFAVPVSVMPLAEINRPELKLYDAQKKVYDLQAKQLKTNLTPKLGAFAQGYYGRPTYNIVNNSFGLFGMVGVRFSWPLNGLYTNSNDKALLNINRQYIDVQKETFVFNTNITLTQQSADAVKYQSLLAKDESIVDLRTSVKTAANAQLTNGVITSHDFINKVNDENRARLNMAVHRIQLLQSEYNYKNTSGN
jgi:outer membrane protein TolC